MGVEVQLELALELWSGSLQRCSHLDSPSQFAQLWVALLVPQQARPLGQQQVVQLVTLATSTRRRFLTAPGLCLEKQRLAPTRSQRRQWTPSPMPRELPSVWLVALVAHLSELRTLELHAFSVSVGCLCEGHKT